MIVCFFYYRVVWKFNFDVYIFQTNNADIILDLQANILYMYGVVDSGSGLVSVTCRPNTQIYQYKYTIFFYYISSF